MSVGLLLIWVAPAAAQAPPVQAPPAVEEEPIEVTEEQLDKAADAYLAIMEIQRELQEDLSDVEDQAAVQERIDQAQGEAAIAISEAGLEISEYEQIIRALETDQELRMAFIERIQP